MEELIDALGDVVSEPLPSPFERETIVVQSKGMERWISLSLSERFGIWANGAFPFPRTLVESVLDAVLDSPGDPTPYSRRSLTWALAALLPELDSDPTYSVVSQYLENDEQQVKRFELAAKIAYTFDQYLVYRPEMLLDWQARPPEHWQGKLWARLVDRYGDAHVATRARRFFEQWPALPSKPAAIPGRLCVFGVSALPPLFVKIIAALSERVDVHLFVLSPTRHYLHEGSSGPAKLATELFDEPENPLLASMGHVARGFQSVVEDLLDYVDAPRFVAPADGCMLGVLHSDVLEQRCRGRGEVRPAPVSSKDPSLSFHSCHSRTREVEVLRNELLAAFSEDETLHPSDVVVMAPDIETYAPLIEAAFGLDTGDPQYIPFRIADRTLRTDNPAAKAFLTLLDTVGSRIKASEALDLLQHEAVGRRYSICADRLADVQRLIHDAGIRWGIDAEHRASVGQPQRDENTWRFGLRRLLLGYAMAADGTQMFAGTLPFDTEGDDAELAGQCADFAESLFEAHAALSAPRTPERWAADLERVAISMLGCAGETEWQMRSLREGLASLSEHARRAGFDEPVPLSVIRSLLGDWFDSERTTHEFLTGALTFCAMLPMRSIPFRIVCMMGLNDSDFPRAHRAPSFDLISESPRRGDRSIREEDRYLFLEALLSARDRTIITYVGRSIQDNTAYPPSVVVDELLDTIDSSFYLSEAGEQLRLPFAEAPRLDNVRSRIVVRHPLQPFSPSYFDPEGDRRLFSFSPSDLAGAVALTNPRRDRPPFQRAPLVTDEEPTPVTIEQLSRFIQNPARYLLQNQLGLALEDDPELVEDREPLTLSPLSRYEIGARITDQLIEGHDTGAVALAARQTGILPLGTMGRLTLADVLSEASSVVMTASRWQSERLASFDVEIALDAEVLVGVLYDVFRSGQLQRSFARIRPRTELSMWVRHLALQCVAPTDSSRVSVLVGRGPQVGPSALVFSPVQPPEARRLLAELIAIYRLGQRVPICLFPAAAKRYVETLRRLGARDGAHEKALDAARRAFSDGAGAEAHDPYVARVFGGVDPLCDAPVPFDANGALGLPGFAQLSKRLLSPMIQYVHEAR